MSKTEKTPVLFRVDRRDRRDVFALFPTLPGSLDPSTCTSYQHVGQHATADYLGCIRSSRPATAAEYADLAAELTRRGYVLHVIKAAQRSHHRQRLAELRKV